MGKDWFLESIAADGTHRVQPVHRLPFRIGRDPGLNDFVVDARGLSREHARLEADTAGSLRLTDLDSTNGTFVNRERIQGTRLVGENDILHFGNAEFRLGAQGGPETLPPPDEDDSERTMIVRTGGQKLTQNFVQYEREFFELLRGVGLAAAVQPIVDIGSRALFAYELLGRGAHPVLGPSPARLFELAERLEREAELSAAFRNYGVPIVAPRLGQARLFVNAHPKETFTQGFLDGLKALRQLPSAPRLVVEVHETAVVEIRDMAALAAELRKIDVPFAYDDFGAGQARLVELGEVLPDFVKFDMGLVNGLHAAGEGKQRVVRELVRLVLDLGSVPLAEGIDAEADAQICRDMGFQLLQGYLTGRPVPVDSI